jgi:uncharacterized damage-inducible protein DinB
MADLPSTISSDFAGYYEYIAAHVHKWVDPLTQEQFWHNPFAYGNSVGHLILHMTGNLNYYIGARIAETGYLRNREREFTETEKPDKAKVMRTFDQTIAMVVATIQKQKPDDWMAPYSAEREPEATERFMIFLRSAGHAYHHVGQLVFLSKELTRESEAATRPSLRGVTERHARQGESLALVEHREISKSKATLLVSLSGLAAVISALGLHGWHVYLALTLIGAGLTIGFVRWSQKN